jgi:hypothetical protein
MHYAAQKASHHLGRCAIVVSLLPEHREVKGDGAGGNKSVPCCQQLITVAIATGQAVPNATGPAA